MPDLFDQLWDGGTVATEPAPPAPPAPQPTPAPPGRDEFDKLWDKAPGPEPAPVAAPALAPPPVPVAGEVPEAAPQLPRSPSIAPAGAGEVDLSRGTLGPTPEALAEQRALPEQTRFERLTPEALGEMAEWERASVEARNAGLAGRKLKLIEPKKAKRGTFARFQREIHAQAKEERRVVAESAERLGLPNPDEWSKMGKVGGVEQLGKEWATSGGLIGKIPVVGLVPEMRDAARLVSIVKMFKDEAEGKPRKSHGFFGREIGGFEWSMARPVLIRQLRDIQTREQYAQARGTTTGAKVAEIVSQLPTFMAEFALSGGLATGARAAVGRLGAKVFAKGGKTAARRLAIKTAIWGGKKLAAAGARTASVGMIRVFENSFQRMLPKEFEVTPEGDFIVHEAGAGAAEAFTKGFADTFIEMLSEELGGDISKVAGKGLGLLGKDVGKMFPKFAGKVGSNLKRLQSQWMKATSGTKAEFVRRLFARGGFHGTLPEMAEERAGDLMRSLTGVEDITVLDALMPGWEQLKVEALAFSVPGVVRTGAFVAPSAVKGAERAIGRSAERRRSARKLQSELLTEEGAKKFLAENPEAAAQIADPEVKLTRKSMEKLTGLPIKTSEADRARMQELMQQEAQVEAGEAAQRVEEEQAEVPPAEVEPKKPIIAPSEIAPEVESVVDVDRSIEEIPEAELREEVRKLQERIKFERNDFLTTLPRKGQASKKLKPNSRAAILDIDFFKKVNDQWGHAAGDRLLRGFGQMAQEHFPDKMEAKEIERHGGEEFLIILKDDLSEDARLEAFRKDVEERLKIRDDDGNLHDITISIGIATGVSKGTIAADRALFEAKKLGRNQVVALDKEGKIRHTVVAEVKEEADAGRIQPEEVGRETGVSRRAVKPAPADRGTAGRAVQAERKKDRRRDIAEEAEPGVEGFQPQEDPFDVPVALRQPKGKLVSSHAIIATMQRDFDVPIRVGHFKGRALGIHKLLPGLIRLKGTEAGSLATATHEVAHRVDNVNKLTKGLSSELKREIGPLDYDPKKSRVTEGFAEFVRHLLTLDDAKKVAPKFYKFFTEEWLPAHPDIQKKFQKVKGLVNQWRRQTAGERIKESISKTGKPAKPIGVSTLSFIRERMGDIVHKTYTALKAKGAPIGAFTKAAKSKGFDPQKGTSPLELYDALTQVGPTFANTAIEKGVFSVTGNMKKLGPSLIEVFKEIDPKEYNDWVAWAVARHALESWKKGKHPGIERKDARAYFDEKKNPRWEKAAQKLTDFNNAMIVMLVDAGVLSAENGQRIITSYETYLPLLRVQESMTTRRAGGKKLVDLGSPIKGRKGSGLQLIDPVQATVERAIRFYERANQQQVMNRMVEVALTTKDMGGWIDAVPPSKQKTIFQLERILPQLEDMGVDPEVFDTLEDFAEELLFIWNPVYEQKGAKPIGRVTIEGKPKMFEFDPDLYKSLSGMNYFQLPFFFDMLLGKATRMVRLGATGLSASFGVRNPIRDYFAFLFQKKEAKGLRGLVAPGEMLAVYVYSQAKELAGKAGDPFVVLWKQMGGELAQVLGLDRAMLRKKVRDVVGDSTSHRLMNIVTSPVEAARTVIGVTEVGPRLAEFKAVLTAAGFTREKLLSGEQPPRRVLIAAINAANDVTVNFKRQGWVGQWINRAFPFWNAQLEGVDKFARTWRDNPKKVFLKAAVLAAVSAAYWRAHRDDDWYQEAPDWQKYGFWTITDTDGAPVARIPRPHEWNWLVSAMTEATLDAIYREDPEAMKRYLKELPFQTLPLEEGLPLPAVVKPAVEVAFNWDSFRGQPIVNDMMERRLPADQFSPQTTQTAKELGDALGMSPSKIEHALDAHTGGLFRNMIVPMEKLAVGANFEPADLPGIGGLAIRKDYSKSVDEFYDERDKVTQAFNSAKDRGPVPKDLEKKFRRFSDHAAMMSELRRANRWKEGRDIRFATSRYVIGLARRALEKETLDRYPDLFTGKDLPRHVEKIRDEFVGRKLVDLTSPPPKRRKGEALATLEARRQRQREKKAAAAEFLKTTGLKTTEYFEILRTKARRGGQRTQLLRGGKLTTYGQRVGRLRLELAKKKSAG